MIKWVSCDKCIHYVSKNGNVNQHCCWDGRFDVVIPKASCFLFKKSTSKKAKGMYCKYCAYFPDYINKGRCELHKHILVHKDTKACGKIKLVLEKFNPILKRLAAI